MYLSKMIAEFWDMLFELHKYSKILLSRRPEYIVPTCWKRSVEEQKKLVANGKSWTLKSKHLNGLAVDFLFYINGKPVWESELYETLGRYWESIGGKWGVIDEDGKQVDPYHFEYNHARRIEYIRSQNTLS